jgi:hypothetical protein
MGSHVFKTELDKEGYRLDDGVIFKVEAASFVLNHFQVCLLAHLEFMTWVFPEIKTKMPPGYAAQLDKVLSILWRFMAETSQSAPNKDWYRAAKQLAEV